MRKLVIVIALLAAVGLAAPVAQAAPILSLVELGFKTSNDGVAYDAYPSVLPDLYGDYSAFSFATGLGSISFTFSGEGDHYVAGFFDYQITDVFNNNGFFDEQAFWGGGPPAGWSAKSDDPWALESTPAPPNGGLPIYQQFTLFDGSNPFDNWAWISPGHDVSVALGYAFHLGAGDPARKVTFRVSDLAPLGFYLRQTDPLSDTSIYFSGSSADVGENPVPEPGSVTLLGLGLIAVARTLRRRT